MKTVQEKFQCLVTKIAEHRFISPTKLQITLWERDAYFVNNDIGPITLRTMLHRLRDEGGIEIVAESTTEFERTIENLAQCHELCRFCEEKIQKLSQHMLQSTPHCHVINWLESFESACERILKGPIKTEKFQAKKRLLWDIGDAGSKYVILQDGDEPPIVPYAYKGEGVAGRLMEFIFLNPADQEISFEKLCNACGEKFPKTRSGFVRASAMERWRLRDQILAAFFRFSGTGITRYDYEQ